MSFTEADIVKYRDKVSGKLVEARVPTAVLALLKLRASCSGKPVSDQKLARMAVDVPLGLDQCLVGSIPGYCSGKHGNLQMTVH